MENEKETNPPTEEDIKKEEDIEGTNNDENENSQYNENDDNADGNDDPENEPPTNVGGTGSDIVGNTDDSLSVRKARRERRKRKLGLK